MVVPVSVVAAVVAATVLIVTAVAREPIGAGIYYDDGAYLALGRSLANGGGYVYSNLPGSVPGVKYPPVYPVVLSAGWRVFGLYPENLAVLKLLNALFWAVAAGGSFLLFAGRRRRRVLAAGAVTLFAFLTVPSMSIATVLMAEPLFLSICVASLLLAGAAARQWGAEPADTSPGGEIGRAVGLGLLGAMAFLTRSVGLSLMVALLLPLLLQRRWRNAGIAAVSAGVPSIAWLVWTRAHRGGVPESVAGQYGSYGDWFGRSLDDGVFTRLREIVVANWSPFVETLQLVWVPGARGWALGLILLALGGATVFGLRGVWRRNPALALFPFAYLALVFVWPYEPYRFYYAIVPLLTLLVFEGLWATAAKIRADLPRWGVPIAAITGLVFTANALTYHGRGHALRSWTTPQTIPARAYAPLNHWIRENTQPDAVIASALDPYVHWETGRLAVPSWRFLADDYGRYDRSPEVLAAGLDSAIIRFGARHVALILGENKAARTLEAFVRLYPERALKLVETEGPAVGVVYALAPPGEALWDPESAGEAGTDGAEETAGEEPLKLPD